jgi:hypothetical protein
MHMQLRFKRSRYEDHSYFAEKSYDGHIRICCVSTNPDGVRRSTFGAGIGPNQFEELARLMVEVDPRAAIRAFGAGDAGRRSREAGSRLIRDRRGLAHTCACGGRRRGTTFALSPLSSSGHVTPSWPGTVLPLHPLLAKRRDRALVTAIWNRQEESAPRVVQPP